MRSVSRIGERLCSSAADHVIEDELVARCVGCERGVQLLDTRRFFARCLEAGLTHHERVSERALCRLTLRIHDKADGPELHRRDRMVPVAALRSCRQPDDVARLHLGEHALK